MDFSSMIDALRFVQHELLLLCVVFFTLGALDDLGFDLAYIVFRITGRMRGADRIPSAPSGLSQPLAIFLPAWQEAEVIGPTLRRMQSAWGRDAYCIYIGCYRNDPDTIAAALVDVTYPEQVKLIINSELGPTTKGDCLNRLWTAMLHDETHGGFRYAGIALHDAEDWVHPQELSLYRHYLPRHAMVQIPVMPFIPARGAWIAGHYADEFTESHGKTLRVRHALGGSLPAAGVGCAFDRDMMHFIAQDRGGLPFSSDSLVEDYELGLLIHDLGGQAILAYHQGTDGTIIATRALFPTAIDDAVRQKTRWLTGIALAGWDRMGWRGGLVEYWMRLHDRRSVLAALILAMGYGLMLLSVALWAIAPAPMASGKDSVWSQLALFCAVILVWRIVVRAIFVARRYGWWQGLLSMARQPVANMIAIMAGYRSVVRYTRYCLGRPLNWDKTAHHGPDHAAVRAEQVEESSERG